MKRPLTAEESAREELAHKEFEAKFPPMHGQERFLHSQGFRFGYRAALAVCEAQVAAASDASWGLGVIAEHNRMAAALTNQRDYLAACEALLREIGAYCEPIAPGLDPVGKALYERIGPLLAVEE